MRFLRLYFQMNNPLIRALLVLLAVLVQDFVLAQDVIIPAQTVRVVNGTIPIPFVAVINITASTGAISDAEGLVLIPERLASDTLVFRFIGFESKTVLPGVIIGKTISMDENPYGIDEVLITSRITPDEAKAHGIKVVGSLQITSIISGVPSGTSADLLQNTGGVNIQQSQQGGGSPVIRGFEANRVLLVVDGVRMNNAIYRSGHLHNAISVDANIIESLQVTLGPSSVRYGSDALGGVIHFQTHRPRFISDPNKPHMSGLISTQYKSVNSSNTLHARVESGGEKWGSVMSFSSSEYGDLRMGSNRMHGDSAWGLVSFYVESVEGNDSLITNPNPLIQKHTGYSQKDFMHKLRVAIPGGALQTNIQYSLSSNIPRFDKLNDLTADSLGLKWAEWSYGPQSRLLTSINWEQYLGIPGSVHTTLAYQQIGESRIKRRMGNLTRDILTEKVDVLSFSSYWVSSPFRGDGWEFELGVDGQWNGVTSTSNSPTTLMTRYPNGGSTMLSMGAYTAATRTKANKVFNAGLRYSYSSIYAEFDFTETPNFLPFTEINSGHGAVTGNISADIILGNKFSSISSLSSGFRHPNIDDVGKIREKGGYLLVPSDSLKAEYLYSFDESITFKPLADSEKLIISVAGFASYWKDAISPTNSTFMGDSVILYDGDMVRVQRNENIGNAFVRGARIEVKSQISPSTVFFGTVNFTRGSILETGAPISHISPTFGRLSLNKQLKSDKESWAIEAFALFNSAKDLDQYGPGSTDNPQEALSTGTPAWWTLNLESHFEISDNMHAQIGLSNLLDVHYKSFSSGISAPGRGVYFAVHANF